MVKISVRPFGVKAVSSFKKPRVMETDQLLETTWKNLRGELRGFLVGQVGEAATADDLLQDVFLKLHRRVGSLEKASPRAWLYKVARNAVTDHWRRRRETAALPEISLTPKFPRTKASGKARSLPAPDDREPARRVRGRSAPDGTGRTAASGSGAPARPLADGAQIPRAAWPRATQGDAPAMLRVRAFERRPRARLLAPPGVLRPPRSLPGNFTEPTPTNA